VQAWLDRPVVRDSLAVGVATGLYGVSFGAVSVASGLSATQTCVLSLLVFTGASQFALVGVLASGGGAPSAAATAVLLGSRNTLYGLRLATRLGVRGRRRALAAHLVIDESTAMATAQDGDADGRIGFWVTGVAVFVLWNAMTLVGALAGNALGDPRTYGLDAAVGAAFLGLLWPRLAERGMVPVALAAAALAVVLVPLAPAGLPVLAVGVVALALGVGAPLRPRAQGERP
jgi:predicted branched-subunit amino acid permease